MFNRRLRTFLCHILILFELLFGLVLRWVYMGEKSDALKPNWI